MHKHHTSEEGYKYKPDYKWPVDGSVKDCPRCKEELELVENKKTYFESQPKKAWFSKKAFSTKNSPPLEW